MKVLICGLLMAGMSALFDRQPNGAVQQRGATSDGNAKVMVLTGGAGGTSAAPMAFQGDGSTAHTFAFTTADGATVNVGEGGDNMIVATVDVAADGGGTNTNRHVVRMRRMDANDPEAANRGWLGVSLGHVPDAVAAQLNVEDDGVMILNVVEDSPADRAGLEAHDIIVSVAGENVEGDVGRATEIIRERKPGDAVQVVVVREGQPQTLNVTLGSRVEMGAAAWKFRHAPGEVEESIRTHGRMLQKDANGNWVMKDLGNLADLSNLPAQIQAIIPQGGNRTVQVTVNNGEKNVSVSTERDGTTIEVEQADDGPITVTRTDAQGAETTATYADRDELAAKDAEAAEVFGDSDQTFVMQLDGDGMLSGNLNFNFDTDIDVEELHENMMQWHEQFEQGMGAAGESYRQAMEEIHAAIERIKQEHGIDGNAFGFMLGAPAAPGAPATPAPHVFRFSGRAQQSFEVQPDGTIKSTVRRGDTEVVEVFTNEADLQQRDAELYQKFIETRNAEH